MTKLKEVYRTFSSAERASESLKKAGINVSWGEKLDRLSNVEMVWGGHLKNATMHKTAGYWIEGNTFGVKEEIKRIGATWKPKHKAWYMPAATKANESISMALMKEIAMAKKGGKR